MPVSELEKKPERTINTNKMMKSIDRGMVSKKSVTSNLKDNLLWRSTWVCQEKNRKISCLDTT